MDPRWRRRTRFLWLSVALVAGCAGPGNVASPAGSFAAPGPSVFHDAPATDPVNTPVGSPHTIAGSCMSSFSADRCQALALKAATELSIPFDSIAAIDVVPNPSPEQMDRAHRTFLSILLRDGSRHGVTVSCPGISAAYDASCMPSPAVSLGYPGGVDAHVGYTDFPENATPFPALDPGAVANAKALRIDTLVVPVSATGSQTMVVGRASLANGYLAEAQFALADPWPSDVLFKGGIRLEVRPVAGGEPLTNLYEHGWHAGVEDVEATITFDIAWFLPGATIPIVDLVVR